MARRKSFSNESTSKGILDSLNDLDPVKYESYKQVKKVLNDEIKEELKEIKNEENESEVKEEISSALESSVNEEEKNTKNDDNKEEQKTEIIVEEKKEEPIVEDKVEEDKVEEKNVSEEEKKQTKKNVKRTYNIREDQVDKLLEIKFRTKESIDSIVQAAIDIIYEKKSEEWLKK